MRLYIPRLMFAALTAMAPFAAHAQCNMSATTALSARYVYQDFAKVASNRPGLVVMPLAACPIGDGLLLFDVWNRTDIGGYGQNNVGNEVDLELAYDFTAGPFAIEAYSAYYALAPLPTLKNGAFETYLDAGYPIDLGFAKVKPSIRPIHIVGSGFVPNLTLLRWRMPVEFPLPFLGNGWSAMVEPSVTYNFDRQPHQPKVSWRPTASLDYDFDASHRVSFIGKEGNGHFTAEAAYRIKF